MRSKIITSGYKFIDIDAFACIFAYKEFLDAQGEDSDIAITAQYNSSITKRYRDLNMGAVFPDVKEKSFVIMDVSDPDYFERFVDLNAVSNIFDHHPGFEEYWKKKLGKAAVIEPVGAAATLVYREYKKMGLLKKISPMSAELLAVAILSNTLNFQAKITKEEDRIAYEELKKFFAYSSEFESRYFSEIQKNIEKDISGSLDGDAKHIHPGLFIGQLEIWDSKRILDAFSSSIKSFLKAADSEVAFLNLIDLHKKRNILMFNDEKTLQYVKKYFPEFEYIPEEAIAITSHVILRKEILSRIYESDGRGTA